MTATVDGRKRADQVRDKIVTLIRDGSLPPGSKLPTEPQLVEMFGVGRSSVRAAVQSLVGLGLVEMRPGRGAYVARLSLNDVVRMVGAGFHLEYAAAHQLHEARTMIETTAARLAAKRRTASDLEHMRVAVEQYGEAWRADDLDAMINADLGFHAAIIRATGNNVLESILASIAGLLLEQRRQYAMASLDSRGDVVVAGHLALLNAIEAGDPAEAERQARLHMSAVSAQIDAMAEADEQRPNGEET